MPTETVVKNDPLDKDGERVRNLKKILGIGLIVGAGSLLGHRPYPHGYPYPPYPYPPHGMYPIYG